MTANDGCKGRLIAMAHETLEQLLVGLRAKFEGAYDLTYAANQTNLLPFLHGRCFQVGTAALTLPYSSSSSDRNGGTVFTTSRILALPILKNLAQRPLRYNAACSAALAGCGRGDAADTLRLAGRAGLPFPAGQVVPRQT